MKIPAMVRLTALFLAAFLASFFMARRAPWRLVDTRDLRDSVSDHHGLAMSAGHASLMAAGAEGCTVCHFAHQSKIQRPLWQKEGAADAVFTADADHAGGARTGLCLSCHDGVVAAALSAHSMPSNGQPSVPGLASSHPVGIDYLSAVRRAPESFIDPATNPAIVLEEGKIGCVSCHATHDPTVVSAGNVRREVCVECHRR